MPEGKPPSPSEVHVKMKLRSNAEDAGGGGGDGGGGIGGGGIGGGSGVSIGGGGDAGSGVAFGGGDGSMVVLHTAHATYSLQLPEARFGIAGNSSYKPMMDAHERECLARLCPFADGNPRRLKRIINVFNVGRRVVELRRGKEWPGLADFKPKLLKFVIMLEQWPYRAPARPKR